MRGSWVSHTAPRDPHGIPAGPGIACADQRRMTRPRYDSSMLATAAVPDALHGARVLFWEGAKSREMRQEPRNAPREK